MRDLEWLKDVFRTLDEGQVSASAGPRPPASGEMLGAASEAADLLASLMASGQPPPALTDEASLRRAYAEAGAPFGADEAGLARWWREIARQAQSDDAS